MSDPDDWPQQWFEKADHDLRTAEVVLDLDMPLTDVACYHAQQGVEKYLKGFLTLHGWLFRKTHDLIYLLTACADIDPEFERWEEACIDLTPYAVEVRYPGDFHSPNVQEAVKALENAKQIRAFVLARAKGEESG